MSNSRTLVRKNKFIPHKCTIAKHKINGRELWSAIRGRHEYSVHATKGHRLRRVYK